MNLSNGNGRQTLLAKEIAFLALIGIFYKLLWFKMLRRIYHSNRKIQHRNTRFLPLGKRLWHGKIVNIGGEHLLLSRWKEMWDEQVKRFQSEGFSIAWSIWILISSNTWSLHSMEST